MCLWLLTDSIIANVVITNGINTLLNAANDMQVYVISCMNICVSKPMNLHTDVSVSSECWSIYLFGVDLIEFMSIVFHVNHTSIDIIPCGDNDVVITTLYCWS